MRYVILPVEDAGIVFSESELSHMRKSTDGTQVIVHEETLIEKRNAMGLATLPSEETGTFQWTYPVYVHGSAELQSLLASPGWNQETTETENV